MEDVCKYKIPSFGELQDFSIRYFEGDSFRIMKPSYSGMSNNTRITEEYDTVEEAEKALSEKLIKNGQERMFDLQKRFANTAKTVAEIQEKGLAEFLVPSDDKK
jgi:hypothetical protein